MQGTQPTSFGFEPEVDLSSAGMKPSSVVIGDFNGDGKLDIAVANFSSNTIAVFLNKGRGTFGTPVMTAVNITNGLGSIAAGDFNEDGKLDLMVATIAGPQVDIVLLGNGDGTFSQQPPVPNSFGFFTARVVDLNGDHHLDLVTGGNGSLAVLLGNGHGTFTLSGLPVPYQLPGPFIGITAGDFNNDGKLDIVAIDLLTAHLLFYAGNGDGTLQAPTSTSSLILSGAFSLRSADFNGDGKLDLLMGSAGGAAIHSGNGDGSFQLGLDSGIAVFIVSR